MLKIIKAYNGLATTEVEGQIKLRLVGATRPYPEKLPAQHDPKSIKI
jgi:hypothetical protein